MLVSLQLAPLNNAIDPKDSSASINMRSNRVCGRLVLGFRDPVCSQVVLKLNKWHDRREWRSLVDNGRTIQDDLAHRFSKANSELKGE